MIDLIDAEVKEKNKGSELTSPIKNDYLTNPIKDDYLVDPIADDIYSADPTDSMDDYLMDSIDEEEIMLNKEWVQALIDLDEAGYNK